MYNRIMNIRTQIQSDLLEAFRKIGIDAKHAVLGTSDKADYQCNACFAVAKELKCPPAEIGARIVAAFKSTAAVMGFSPPGFLNINVTDKALVNLGNEILKTKRIPIEKQKARTIFFDYGGANVAKELHIGHLRPPIVGEALKRVMASCGHRVVADAYLGDWGLPLGLVIAWMESEKISIDKLVLEDLNVIYPLASRRKDTDGAFRKRAEEITAKLQKRGEPYYSIWQRIRELSVEKIDENYRRLGCTFDYLNGESHAAPFVDETLGILEKYTFVDRDCLLMDVKRDTDTGPMPPVILRKGNGGDLYATSDVATILYRYRDHRPDEFIYITDFRQSLHFEQVFRVVKKAGIVPESVHMHHIGLGTITGTDGKPFKTRDGGAIKLEDIMNVVVDAARVRLAENGRDDKDGRLAEAIGQAALKFTDLGNNVKSGYVFDPARATAFEGKTGPYILYTIARINSVLRKACCEARAGSTGLVCGTRKSEARNRLWRGSNSPRLRPVLPALASQQASQGFADGCMRTLLASVLKLSDAFTSASQSYTLNGIVDAVYDLAVAFNGFYTSTPILKEADALKRENLLAMCELVKTSLEFAMHTLAIDVVESM